MTNINEIKDELWFKAKPWLICGTGPSLNEWKKVYSEFFNIWALYSAVDITKYADVLAFQDQESIDKIYSPEHFPNNFRYIATRVQNVTILGDDPRVRAIEYQEDVHDYFSGTSPTGGKQFPRSNSTSFAFLFLGHAGVKKIYTIGIDGGKGFANVHKNYIAMNGDCDFNVENSTNQHWCNEYAMKWEKI